MAVEWEEMKLVHCVPGSPLLCRLWVGRVHLGDFVPLIRFVDEIFGAGTEMGKDETSFSLEQASSTNGFKSKPTTIYIVYQGAGPTRCFCNEKTCTFSTILQLAFYVIHRLSMAFELGQYVELSLC